MMLRTQILRVTLNIAPPLLYIITEKKQQLKSLNSIGSIFQKLSLAEKDVCYSVEMSERTHSTGVERQGAATDVGYVEAEGGSVGSEGGGFNAEGRGAAAEEGGAAD